MEASSILPRIDTRTIDTPPIRRVPLDATRLAVAVESIRGTATPMRFASLRDVARKLERTGVGIPGYDACDVAFREGVSEVHFARLLGPAAATATVALPGAVGTSFTIATVEPGEWANGATGGLTAEVILGPGGGGQRVVILRRGTTELGRTTAETTRAALMASVELILATRKPDGTLEQSFTVSAGAELGVPNVAAPANFAGGTADSAGITSTQVRAALDRVSIDEGPMQVAVPGRTSDATNTVLLDYAAATKRTALIEQTDGLAVGAITASAGVLRGLGVGAEGRARLGGMWAQHARGPGLVPGTFRTVPWTVVVAGLIARLEAAEGHPNVAPFGDYGVPRWATSLTREFSEADSETLVAAGCNVAHTYLGVPRNRTFHSLEDPTVGASEWADLAHTRVDRVVHAHARDIGRAMGARVIDRTTLGEFASRLRQRLEAMRRAGALLGDTPDQAFHVDTDSVNDDATMAAREVNAAVGLRMSEHAEFVNITLAKVPIGQEV